MLYFRAVGGNYLVVMALCWCAGEHAHVPEPPQRPVFSTRLGTDFEVRHQECRWEKTGSVAALREFVLEWRKTVGTQLEPQQDGRK